ncbi:hypothetical protein VTK73DRAFT_3461 [Phialemonium thermophilum]|uniref:Glucose-methanol-choline oxidoreductase N-terminal domain-containing protein n=1 Tax=Phialemonium thermophilum TaxID=223376 RepID=A0ABR3VJG4_9PEZI
MDGKLYRQEGFNVLAQGFNQSGWAYVTPNDQPTRKNRTFGHTTYMFSHGERGGPLATYLVSASQRTKVFDLLTNTAARRVVRQGGHAVGVELDCQTEDGRPLIVNVTPQRGRVILSAGTFGTAKLLFRSPCNTGCCFVPPSTRHGSLTDGVVQAASAPSTSCRSSRARPRTAAA